MLLKKLRELPRKTKILLACIALLLIAAIVFSNVVSLRARAKKMEARDCKLALEAAQQRIDKESARHDPYTEAQAKAAATQNVVAWEELCPYGGDCYLLPDNGDYDVFCALHGEDKKLCTRLNAENALSQVDTELRAQQALGRPVPETVAVRLNGTTYTAERTDADPGFRRTGSAARGYKGTVIFYLADENGLHGFYFADDYHCANWADSGEWTGDSQT